MEDVATSALRILAADEDHDALERTAGMLSVLGHEVIASAVDLAEATEAIAREDPDLSMVLVHDDDEHALDLIEEIHAFARGPVVALLDQENAAFIRRAADRGVAAYGRPTDPEAVQSAIELAMHAHHERVELGDQVQRLESALERRAVIERAKGILMERHGLGERDAFERLRRHARSRSAAVVEVAQAVADGHLLLRDGE